MSVEERIADLSSLIRSRNRDQVVELLQDLEWRNQVAEMLSQLSLAELAQLVDLIGDHDFAEIVGELDPVDGAELLSRLAVADAADILEAMDPDEAADVVGEIDSADVDRILVAMEPVEAAELRELLAYPADTAGGRMTPAFVSIAPDLRSDQAVVALRKLSEQAETISYIYVTDDNDRLVGVLSLRGLVLSPPSTPVSDVMVPDVITVSVDEDQEIAARTLVENELMALPVVDHDQRLVGIITSDDVADILEQEATEDITRIGGSEPLEGSYLRASPMDLWKKRVVWLLVLFLAQAYTGTVLAYYEDVLEAATALVFFMPLLIGTGGNAGSQVVTTIVRAMAIDDIRLRDLLSIIWKELQTGLMLGGVMALVVFGRAVMLGVGRDMGIVVAITITAIVIWAVTVGAVLPLVLRQLRVDPAVVSAPFISTLVDGTGLIIYFTVAITVLEL